MSIYVYTMNNTDVLQYTTLQNNIFRVLCKKAGSKSNQRTLATELKVTPAAVSRSLPLLEKDNLISIHSHKTMNLKEIELNRSNHFAIQLKQVENLKSLYLSGFVEYITENYAGCTVILFGSYARGDDTIASDIDIAVIGTKDKKIDTDRFGSILERPIRITVIQSTQKLSEEFRQNMCSGIVLQRGMDW